MRVTTSMLHRSALADLEGSWSRVQHLQERIATGRRILKPSDDPSGTDRTMSSNSEVRINDQYIRTLEESRSFVQTSETAINQLVEIGIKINTIAIQVADDSYGPETMISLGKELDALLEEAIAVANSEYAGMRLFGGQATKSIPFTSDKNSSGEVSKVMVDVVGGENDIQRLVSENLLLTINQTGSDLFGEDLEFFSNLIELRDAAAAGSHENAQSLIDDVTGDLDRINLSQSVTGSLFNRIDGQIKWTEEQNLELEGIRSEYEDLDMVEAMMDFQKEQAILEAALSTTAQTLRLSMVNYM